ncbi:MAG: SUMF1/EgtB/PvdO family nonheme iron enzyme [bacterium]
MGVKRFFLLLFVSVFSTATLYSQTVKAGVNLNGKSETEGLFKAGDVTFRMGFIPGGITFPTDQRDDKTATVKGSYWIGETAVTYQLWYTVRTWAEKNGYKFFDLDVGTIPPTSENKNHPVHGISWHDAIVWCNAATEWYNATKGENYEPVYYKDKKFTKPIRTTFSDASFRSTRIKILDHPYVKESANGFRLLTRKEWELAARYIGTVDPATVTETAQTPLAKERIAISINGAAYYYTPGYYASGAYDRADEWLRQANKKNTPATQVAATQAVAWYVDNSGGDVHDVALLKPNQLHLYDMNGNVYTWCDSPDTDAPQDRVISGGSFHDLMYRMSITFSNFKDPQTRDKTFGIRLAKNDK